MRDWADLDDPAVNTFDHRANVRILRDFLSTSEDILAVARAGHPKSRWRSGVLAVTDTRVVFVCERVARQPFVLSLSFDAIESVSMEEQPLSGVVALATTEGPFRFDSIRPKERTWPIYWRIGERIGQLPLGEHS